MDNNNPNNGQQVVQEVPNNKGKKSNTGIVTLLVIIILGLCGYLVYDKVLSTKDIDNDNKDSGDVERDSVDNFEILSVDDYISLEDVSFNSKVSTKKVKLNKLDDSLTKEFYKEQDDVINSIHVSDSEVFNVEYELRYFINNDILSVLYDIKETSEIGTCATKMAVTNIDLKNNRVISEEELLEKANTSYIDIVEKRYDSELESWTKLNESNGTEISYYEVTYKDFKNNKSKYIDIGLERLPGVIYTYIEDGKIKYDYYEISLGTLFHQVGKGGCFNWKTEVLGNI